MGLLSDIWTGLTGSTGGGLIDKALDTVKDYFPPDMSPSQKAELEYKLKQMGLEADLALREADNQSEQLLNQRIAEYEGTAKDLKALPIVGPIMIFLRGLQRPAWGIAAMWMDYQWFAVWSDLSEQQELALVMINLLVLGFLFGERAIKNLAPIIKQFMEARKG